MTYRFFRSSGILFVSLLFLFLLHPRLPAAQDMPARSHSIVPFAGSNTTNYAGPVEGKLQIIAIMVEFQPDTNRFTSGNGTFGPGSIPYLENPGTHIDALPHNQAYFEAHLEFTKHYFETMSGGMLQVNYHVLPGIYRLPNEMQEYSPIGENPELTPLGFLAADAWELVANEGALPFTVNPGENTAFVIFHAGIGRDIELTGTTLDKTPQDIPSVYLSNNALRRLLNDPSFTGFEIDNGNLLVDNTLILPRTLSRSGEDAVGNPFVLSLSVNGMATAQIGSHLGLPDLFNTETGQSGIGRFGLMDGAGIFAYNGLFPPELSAWERIFLGWAEPFSVQYDKTGLISLPAISLRNENSIARINLSSDEYFLIENRHRNPQGNGVTLTIQKPDGTLARQTFSNTDSDFVNQSTGFDELLEPGVVVHVNNHDFSLPGGFDDADGAERDLDGGILIWHIDESVIRQKIETGGINNNPERKAVNLQEADGAQDIGRPATIGLFQNEVNGSAFDFWWAGNNATVVTQTGEIQLYENRFGPDTFPANRSNSGAPSFFELYDFTDNLAIAGLRIRPVSPFSELYEPADAQHDPSISSFMQSDDTYYQRYPLAMQPYDASGLNRVLIPGTNGIRFYDPVSKTLEAFIPSDVPIQQPFTGFENNLFTIAGRPASAGGEIDLKGFELADGEPVEKWQTGIPSPAGFISSSEPNILDIDGTPFRFDVENLTFEELPYRFWSSERAGAYQSQIEENNLILHFPGGREEFTISTEDGNSRVHTGIINTPGNEYFFYLLMDGRLSLFSPETGYHNEQIIAKSAFIGWPAFADFNGDGYPDFLFIDHEQNRLNIKNRNGAMLPNFPLRPPQGMFFTGTPLVADINNSGSNEILVTAQDNYSLNIFAYNQEGELVEGFPLFVGSVSGSLNQPVHPLFIDDYLVAISHSGDLRTWRFPNLGPVSWATRYGNQTSNKVSGSINYGTEPSPVFSLLNTEETYNWPNPARDETTLRYQTSEPAEMRVKITTVSGRFLYDEQFQSRGGPPEEIILDTSSWASGGYFALVEAKTGSQTERTIVKIAIAR